MKWFKKVCLFVCLIALFPSCEKPHEEFILAEKEKILKLHDLQRDYHFDKDSMAFVSQLSDHFISVNDGVIRTPRKEETLSRYNRYFASVEFVKWDDESEPLIELSDDGTMGYTIVDKMVVVAYKDTNGITVEGKTHFAWTAIYKKYGSEWKVECVTSTERPVDAVK